jgi:serine O-acetyltransferase
MGNCDSDKILAKAAFELRRTYETGPEWSTKGQLLPDPKGLIDLILELRSIVFPGYFDSSNSGSGGDSSCLLERLGVVYWRLARQIHNTVAHVCTSKCETSCNIMQESCKQAEAFILQLPEIRSMLLLDVEAAYSGDPAATDYNEIILSYPGVLAITIHRIAHIFYQLNLPLIARILSEYAHSVTGIDIHPGAKIGRSFFIDHGTGVVIGQTCEIGNNVKLYQGVTLGALSFPKDGHGNLIRNQKRHPTIEDGVTVYAGATILGGETIVGKGSVIGGNVWLTESVPPYSKIINKPSIELR